MSDLQTQTERLRYTLQHNSWDRQHDKFKIRVFRELTELSMRFDQLEATPRSPSVERAQ